MGEGGVWGGICVKFVGFMLGGMAEKEEMGEICEDIVDLCVNGGGITRRMPFTA